MKGEEGGRKKQDEQKRRQQEEKNGLPRLCTSTTEPIPFCNKYYRYRLHGHMAISTDLGPFPL